MRCWGHDLRVLLSRTTLSSAWSQSGMPSTQRMISANRTSLAVRLLIFMSLFSTNSSEQRLACQVDSYPSTHARAG